jgi:hypothetical protein
LSLNPKVLLIGLVAAVLLGFGIMSMGTTSAHVPQDEICNPGQDTDTVNNAACIGIADLGNANLHDNDHRCMDASTALTSGQVLVRFFGDVVPICFDHVWATTSGPTGAIGFDSNDVGRWLTAVCGNVSNTGADFEFSPSGIPSGGADECPGIVNKLTDRIHINDYNGGILAFFQCSDVGTATIVIDHDGAFFSFIIICTGGVSTATIAASPTTVEIVPAPGNQSYSVVTVTVADSLGRRIDGVEVDMITDNCWWRAEVGTQQTGPTSPRGGLDANVRTHVAFSDTDLPGTANNEDGAGIPGDTGYLASTSLIVNPSFPGLTDPFSGAPIAAGTAESVLQCFPGTESSLAGLARPGPANITAIVRRTGIPLTSAGYCAIRQAGQSGSALTASQFNVCDPITGLASNLTGTGSYPFGYDDIVLTVTVTVIGTPASITVSASPTSLRCGEKATITATIKDSAGQNVSDHTRVELVTNMGGVLAGTGAVTAGLGAGVVPVSSTVAETFAGVATAFLITSEVTTGPYEVVVTAGGSFPVYSGLQIPSNTSFTQSAVNAIPGYVVLPSGRTQVDGDLWVGPTYVGGGGDISPISGTQEPATVGVFSTAPVSAQATVTCSGPAPAAPVAPVQVPQITAPRTGTGITPPNTGDAGLASDSGSSWTLFALGGLVALAIAGVATVKVARR